MRNFYQCSFCGERFVVEGRATGTEHACETLATEILRYQAHGLERRAQAIHSEADAELVRATEAGQALRFYCPAKPLKFRAKAKADKCGPKCWGAKREDCSCECGGYNHGIDRAPTN